MKYIYQIAALFLFLAFASCSTSRYYQTDADGYQNYDEQPTITYQQFYTELSPYGSWINYPSYGPVWVPNQPNFRPYYTNGQWVYTDYGWTWASDYNWGWAPFHYGRWMQDPSYGWVWVPGTEWAPAWVAWRGGGDYYGWAPLGPGMNTSNYYGSIPSYDWTFVPSRYITSPRINNYYVNQSRNGMIINNTRIINNTTVSTANRRAATPYYNAGPPVREVERSTGSQIRKYNVVQSDKPTAPQITNNAIRVFRPAVKQTANSAPERITDLNQTRTTNRNSEQNTNQAAPVREFPRDQTPQINRNEPPVNSRPSIAPNRNNAPERAFPNTNTQPPVQRNPDVIQQNRSNSNVQPAAPREENTNPPVRTFPNRNATPPVQRNPDPVMQNPSERQPAAAPDNRSNAPVRTFPGRQQLNANSRAQNTRNSTPVRNQEARSSNPPERKPVVREKQEIKVVRPAQTVREFNNKNEKK